MSSCYTRSVQEGMFNGPDRLKLGLLHLPCLYHSCSLHAHFMAGEARMVRTRYAPVHGQEPLCLNAEPLWVGCRILLCLPCSCAWLKHLPAETGWWKKKHESENWRTHVFISGLKEIDSKGKTWVLTGSIPEECDHASVSKEKWRIWPAF